MKKFICEENINEVKRRKSRGRTLRAVARREAEPSRGEVPAHVGWRDSLLLRRCWGVGAALAGLWGELLHGRHEVTGLGTVEVMAGERARGGCGECSVSLTIFCRNFTDGPENAAK